jgi:hypothetical protein
MPEEEGDGDLTPKSEERDRAGSRPDVASLRSDAMFEDEETALAWWEAGVRQ